MNAKTLDEFFEFHVRFAADAIRRGIELVEQIVGETEDGTRYMFMAGDTRMSRDSYLLVVRAFFAAHRVVRVTIISEAWQVRVSAAEAAALAARGEEVTRPCENPHREEILLVAAYDSQRRLLREWPIVRADGVRSLSAHEEPGAADALDGRIFQLLQDAAIPVERRMAEASTEQLAVATGCQVMVIPPPALPN